ACRQRARAVDRQDHRGKPRREHQPRRGALGQGAHCDGELPARGLMRSLCRKLAAVCRYTSRLAFFLKPCPSSLASRYHTSPPAARTLHNSCCDSDHGTRRSLAPPTTSSGSLMRVALERGETRCTTHWPLVSRRSRDTGW